MKEQSICAQTVGVMKSETKQIMEGMEKINILLNGYKRILIGPFVWKLKRFI